MNITLSSGQNAAVPPGEDGAVVLDAALALDHTGKQVTINAQHRSYAAQQRNDHIHGYANVGAGEGFHPVCRHRVHQCDDHTKHHGAQNAANGTLHGFLGLTTGQSLCLPNARPAK